MIVAPALESVYYSFTNWTGIGGAKFIGIRNLRTMFTSGQFWNAMLHNVLWTVFFLIVPIAPGLARAFMLSRIKRFQHLFRVIYFIPYILATIISAVVCENLLSPTSGIGIGIEGLLIHTLGQHELPRQSLACPAHRGVREQLAVVGIPGRDVPGRDDQDLPFAV